MDMEGNLYGTVIAPQVRAGKIPESVVDEAVRRVLRVKFALGLFDHPYTAGRPGLRRHAERRAAARKVAGETFVLLKNDPAWRRGNLCCRSHRQGRKVALIGPLADNQREMLGAWAVTGDPKCRHAADGAGRAAGRPLLYAPRAASCSPAKDANVLKRVTSAAARTPDAPLPIPDDAKTIAEAVETAKKADVAILAWASLPTGWKARPPAAPHWALPARSSSFWRLSLPPASR
jgi:beta-glucosidase-like glycosyl hydrolase